MQSAPAAKVRFTVVGSTEEIKTFSNSVAGIFKKGNWEIGPTNFYGEATNGFDSTIIDHGEGVHCHSADWDGPSSSAARKALEQIGYPCKLYMFGSDGGSNVFYVEIGASQSASK